MANFAAGLAWPSCSGRAGRAGQPAELAPVYVLLASDEGSGISGARVAVTEGRPIL